MKTFRNILTIALISIVGQVYGQPEILKEIRISTGQFRAFCGKCRIYHDIRFKKELEYNLADSSFYYHKKISRRLKKIAIKSNDLFDKRETHIKLDSIADNFTDYKPWIDNNQRHFVSHQKEIGELIAYFKEIVPNDKIIEIEYYDDQKLQRFQITDIDTTWETQDSFYLGSYPLYFEWEVRISRVPDSILSKINWDQNTFAKLKSKLDNAGCISINNENPIEIDYKRDFFGETTYSIFANYDSAKLKKLKSFRTDLHFFCDSVAWSYDTGAL